MNIENNKGQTFSEMLATCNVSTLEKYAQDQCKIDSKFACKKRVVSRKNQQCEASLCMYKKLVANCERLAQQQQKSS